MKKIKVIALNHGNFFAGGERSLLILMESLDRQKYDLTIGTGQKNPLRARAAELAIPSYSYSMPTKGLLSAPVRIFSLAIFILQTMTRRPDIVYANSITMSAVSGILAILGYKTVGHVRDIIAVGKLSTWLISKNDYVIANSHATAEFLKQLKIPQHKIKVIYNGVNLDEFDPSKLDRAKTRQQFHFKNSQFIVGSIGTFHPRKNQLWLIQSLAPLLHQNIQIKLLVVGPIDDQDYFSKIKNALTDLQLQDSVRIEGPRQDIAQVMNACDLIILPSVQEPFGRVLIEAMALGKPVIGTNVGGVKEVITQDVGFLIDLDDSASLMRLVQKIFSSAKLYNLLSKAGRQRAQKYFSDDRYAKEIGLIYSKLIRK